MRRVQMAKAGVQDTSDAGAALGRKTLGEGREGRRQAKTAAAPGGRLPARPEDPLEVWCWLPGPVLAPSLPYFPVSRAAGCSFSFMRKAGWNLLHRQRARSTIGGRDGLGRGGGDTLGVSFRPLTRPHLPVPGPLQAPGGLGPRLRKPTPALECPYSCSAPFPAPSAFQGSTQIAPLS